MSNELAFSTMLQPQVQNGEKNEIVTIESVPEDQREEIMAIVNSIDISKSDEVMVYGNKSQSEVSKFANDVLENVRMKDGGEAGELIGDLMQNVRKMDPKTLSKKNNFLASLPVVGTFFNKVEKHQMKWESMQTFLVEIQKKLEGARYELLKDSKRLDLMFDANYKNFAEIEKYILAGQLYLTNFETEVLAPAREAVNEGADQLATQRLQDLTHTRDHFEKRIHDLKLTRQITLQTAPQIRTIQQNHRVLADKINSSIHNTLPLWKNQVVLSLSLARAENALQAQQDVTETTNNLLVQNATQLRLSSVEIAKENEKGVVSLDALKESQSQIIATLEETLQIQSEGRNNRKIVEDELAKMEGEMREKVYQLAQAEQKSNSPY